MLADAAGEVAGSLARLTTVALFAITFLVQPSQIPSASMVPALLVGDFVLVNKQVFAPAGHWGWLLPYRNPRRDDIAIFHYPVHPSELLVKRIVAVPGDTLRLHRGRVILNGQPEDEPFALWEPAEPSRYRDEFPSMQSTEPAVQAPWWIELRREVHAGSVRVPPGEYFAMGDNRNNSEDSRYWGWVPRASIIGRPMFVYLSVNEDGGPGGRFRWSRTGHRVR